MTENTPGSVHRRTVIAGAAWTIPVVATAIGAPLAAASGETPTLAFSSAAYTGNFCSPLSGVFVTRTKDGTTPDPQKVVVVTLPEGYAFATGQTTFTDTTDSAGRITLPNIIVPAKGGSAVLSAQSSDLVTNAGVTSSVDGTARIQNNLGATSSFASVPTDAEAVGHNYFLAKNGDLYRENSIIATGVTSVAARYAGNSTESVGYVANGVATYNNQTGAPRTFGSIPSDAVAVGHTYFLTPGGNLYNGNSLIATGVSSAAGQYNGNNIDAVGYIEAAC